MEFTEPALGTKSSMWLFMMMPVPGMTTPEPKWVVDGLRGKPPWLPSLSMTEKEVVLPDSYFQGSPGPTGNRKDFVQGYLGGELLGVGLGGESGYGDFHEGGVGHVLGAVGVDELHRPRPQRWRVGAVLCPRVPKSQFFEDVEELDDVGAAGGGGRRGEDRVAAVGADGGLASFDFIVL